MKKDDILHDIMDVVGGDQSVTYVAFVRDHSGSMNNLIPGTSQRKKDLAMANFNEYIETLKKESEEDMETLVTIIEFDDKINCTETSQLINEISPMKHYWTGGMTALYDAIAKAIGELEVAMSTDNRTNKAALVIVQTDGDENFSKEYSGVDGQKRIQERISELEATDLWTIVFLGENIDEKIAGDIGMTPANFMKMDSTEASYASASAVVKDGLSTFYSARKMGATNTKDFFVSDADPLNQRSPSKAKKEKE